MAFGKVGYMNIIAHAGAIRRFVIAAEDRKFIAPADRHLRDTGHQVLRCALRILAEQAAFMRANRIEITQQCYAP